MQKHYNMAAEPDSDGPHLYEIRLKGHLDPQRALVFENLAIALTPAGITMLTGYVPDQPALHSMLARVRDLGIPLLSVMRHEDTEKTRGKLCGSVLSMVKSWTFAGANMKAAIALLADFPTQNLARRMVYDMTRCAPIRFLGSLLPAHVSLKQPFTFESMDGLESWFDAFSRSLVPFQIDLDRVYYSEWSGYAIVGMHVVETPTLRDLHNRINQELKDVVKDPSAAHDGDEYEFHLTIELGPTGSGNPYKAFYEALPEKQLDVSFLAEHIALFFYTDPFENMSFNCHKVLPLTANSY